MKQSNFGFRFVLCLTLVLAGCTFSESKTEEDSSRYITLMTWNVHNLFDGKDNGFEYDEFKESAGWSTEKYLGRINTISAAIASVEPKPDIIMLQEIESLKILEDIALSTDNGYTWSHFANNSEAALGLGVLSRFPLSESKVHSISIGSETAPRPVLETRIEAENEMFVIFICHWKSKLGGDDKTESLRMACARVILRRIRELWEKEPELGVIIAGDLNENHDDFFRRGSSAICALLPDDPFCVELTGFNDAENEGIISMKEITNLQKDFIVLSRNKPPVPVHFPKGVITMFSPWMGDLEKGSYFYAYNWETIDHFLISGQFFDNSGLEYEKAMVVDNHYFTNASGIPMPYNVRTGAGLSDHLPLLLRLKIIAENE